tara:strand:- start:370 stop:792 length:423 start_codon:yes stop_codon:yes gene_type:complete
MSFDELVKNTRANQQKYVNPISCVMGLIYKNNKLLVVKKDKSLKHWQLVTGFINAGESAEQAMIREAKEETNMKVKIRSIIGTFPYLKDKFQLIIALKLDYVSGKLSAQDDIAQTEWINIKDNVKFKKGSLSEYVYKSFK